MMKRTLRSSAAAALALLCALMPTTDGEAANPPAEASDTVAGSNTVTATAVSDSSEDAPLMLVVGDSYTSGEMLDDPDERFSSLIARAEGWREENRAIGGTGYVVGAATSLPDDEAPNYRGVLDSTPIAPADVVLVTGGGNDAAVWQPGDEQQIRAFYRDLRDRYPIAQIIVVAPFWNADDEPESLPDIRAAVRSAAAAVGARYIDLNEPLHHHPALILPDGDHPNAAGNQVLARRIIAALQHG